MNKSILKLLLSGVTLFFLIAGQGVAQTVTLGDVSDELKEYEETKYDLIGKEITYKDIGEDKYDDIFKESALIFATVKQVSKTLDGINEETLSVEAGYAKNFIDFAVSDLPEMEDRAEELLDNAQNLNPEDDFSGFRGAAKAPKATSGLKSSTDRLNTSIEKLPSLIEDVTELSKKLVE